MPNKSLRYDDGLMLLDGEPFTGIGYFLDADGNLEAEIEYRGGLEWGLKREWYAPGKPSYEGHLYRGVLHGKERDWHRNGNLAEEGDYELGFTIRKKRWDEDGKLVEEYELRETDPDYTSLQELRQIYGNELARQARRENA